MPCRGATVVNERDQRLLLPSAKKFRQADHTIENIQSAIRGLFPAEAADAMLTKLAAYLVFDALIGNTDRHHENWGLCYRADASTKTRTLDVAPSFDHASSLGRELVDTRRSELLGSDERFNLEKAVDRLSPHASC
jgi:serine/threonine protein kinase HipA of HipAB toxin-antitoxin module